MDTRFQIHVARDAPESLMEKALAAMAAWPAGLQQFVARSGWQLYLVDHLGQMFPGADVASFRDVHNSYEHVPALASGRFGFLALAARARQGPDQSFRPVSNIAFCLAHEIGHMIDEMDADDSEEHGGGLAASSDFRTLMRDEHRPVMRFLRKLDLPVAYYAAGRAGLGGEREVLADLFGMEILARSQPELLPQRDFRHIAPRAHRYVCAVLDRIEHDYAGLDVAMPGLKRIDAAKLPAAVHRHALDQSDVKARASSPRPPVAGPKL